MTVKFKASVIGKNVFAFSFGKKKLSLYLSLILNISNEIDALTRHENRLFS
jgi:hypothetical protein